MAANSMPSVWVLACLCLLYIQSNVCRAEKRSDDSAALSSVVENLAQRLNTLESQKSALETDVNTLKSQLAAKQCQSGSEGFDPHHQNEIIQHDSGGRIRVHTKHVTFSTPFTSVPKFTAGLTYMDIDHSSNTRLLVIVEGLSTSGVTLKVQEWADSNNYGVGVRWMACSN